MDNTVTSTTTVTDGKRVDKDSRQHSEYNGYIITITYVYVYRMHEGHVSGGSQRSEWSATDGTNVVEARTLKALKAKIDLM